MRELLFVGSVDERYFHYALPSIASALFFNPDAEYELFLHDRNLFEKRHAPGLDVLGRHVGRFWLSQIADIGEHPSVTRFINAPSRKARYVYINDIDILVTEPVAARHVGIMKQHSLRYSNRVRLNFQRVGEMRLTGWHFSEYDAYYPVVVPPDFDIRDQSRGVDERLLYQLVSNRLGPPRIEHQLRPMHGFHLSPQGYPFHRVAGWGVADASRQAGYRRLIASQLWNELRPHFDPRFGVILDILNAALAAQSVFAPQDLAGLSPLAGPPEAAETGRHARQAAGRRARCSQPRQDASMEAAETTHRQGRGHRQAKQNLGPRHHAIRSALSALPMKPPDCRSQSRA